MLFFDRMTLNPEQLERLHKDLAGLSEDEIKRRLVSHVYREDKRPHVELYLDKLDMERRDRFSAKDRRIQLRILTVAILGVAVGIVSVIATVVTR